MPEYLTQEEAYDSCKRDGRFSFVEEVDTIKIRSTLLIAEGDITSAKSLQKNLPKESNQWNSIYKLYYDAIHELVESFLRFEKVKIDNHRCLYAYLCHKHPELELSWEFFEKVRTKRNGIHYYGTPVTAQDWKETDIQFTLYTKKLFEEIEKKLKTIK